MSVKNDIVALARVEESVALVRVGSATREGVVTSVWVSPGASGPTPLKALGTVRIRQINHRSAQAAARILYARTPERRWVDEEALRGSILELIAGEAKS